MVSYNVTDKWASKRIYLYKHKLCKRIGSWRAFQSLCIPSGDAKFCTWINNFLCDKLHAAISVHLSSGSTVVVATRYNQTLWSSCCFLNSNMHFPESVREQFEPWKRCSDVLLQDLKHCWQLQNWILHTSRRDRIWASSTTQNASQHMLQAVSRSSLLVGLKR